MIRRCRRRVDTLERLSVWSRIRRQHHRNLTSRQLAGFLEARMPGSAIATET